MEDNLQRVFSALMSILILFLLPLYITFEKMDDISYSLALKITTNFVDNVTSKGYLSKEMYNDYVKQLSLTGNAYDVKIEHIAKKYTPAYYYYDNNKVSNIFDYAIAKFEANNSGTVNTYKLSDLQLSYAKSEVKYTDKQILDFLNSSSTIPLITLENQNYQNYNLANDNQVIKYIYPNYNIDGNIDNDNKIYTMNKGDEFNVRIKNSNATIATVLFNAFTLGVGGTDNNIRVYVNYGGTIEEEEYRNLKNSEQ